MEPRPSPSPRGAALPRRPRRAVAVLLLAVLGAAPAAGRAGKIRGRVVDEQGVGVAAAEVVVEGLDLAAFTDGEGRFELRSVPEGSWILTGGLGGSDARVDGIEVAAGAVTRVEIRIRRPPSFGDTLVVEAASLRSEPLFEAPAAATVLTSEEIARRAATRQAPKLFADSPGVELAQGDVYDFNLNSRGYNAAVNRRVLVRIDGRDPSIPGVGSQEWATFASSLDEIATAEMVRGPGSALYGEGAYNGVVDLTTRSPRDSPGGRARLTAGEPAVVRAEARWAGEIGDGWHVKATGGYEVGDDFSRSRVDGGEYLPDRLPAEVVAPPLDEVRIGFASARLDRELAGGRLLVVEAGTGVSEGTVTVSGLGRFQQPDVEMPWARLELSGASWSLSADTTRRESNRQLSLVSGGEVWNDSSVDGVEVIGRLPFAAGRGFAIGGASYRSIRFDSADPGGRQTIFARREDAYRGAVFGQVELDLGAELELVATARWDDSDLHDDRLSPRLAVVWAPTGRATFRLGVSEAFQSPSVAEIFLETPVGPPLDLSAVEAELEPVLGGVELGLASVPQLAVGNPTLEVEKIRGVDVGFRGLVGRRVFVDLTWYRNELDNFTTGLLPQLGTSLGRLNPEFGPYAPPAALDAGAAQTVLDTLEASLGPELFPFLSNDDDGAPVLAVLSLADFGRVDTQGVELAVSALLPAGASLDATYTWFDVDVVRRASEQTLAPNAPRHRASVAFSRAGEKRDVAVSARWVDAFDWTAGIFDGPVPSRVTVDGSLRWRLDDRWSAGVTVSNLLDDEQWQMFGGSLVGRRALAHVTVDW